MRPLLKKIIEQPVTLSIRNHDPVREAVLAPLDADAWNAASLEERAARKQASQDALECARLVAALPALNEMAEFIRKEIE